MTIIIRSLTNRLLLYDRRNAAIGADLEVGSFCLLLGRIAPVFPTIGPPHLLCTEVTCFSAPSTSSRSTPTLTSAGWSRQCEGDDTDGADDVPDVLLTMTEALARPMPAVDPVTMALRSVKLIFIGSSFPNRVPSSHPLVRRSIRPERRYAAGATPATEPIRFGSRTA